MPPLGKKPNGLHLKHVGIMVGDFKRSKYTVSPLVGIFLTEFLCLVLGGCLDNFASKS